MAENKPVWQVTCTKATCRYVETYAKNPGNKRCPKCGSMMIPRKVA